MPAPGPWMLALAVSLGAAWSVDCSRPQGAPTSPPDAADAAPSGSPEVDLRTAAARAEDRRSARDLPPDALRSHDVAVRRAAARASARILASDDAALLRALEDDDDQTVGWGAYGLGEACRGHEDVHVRALAARLLSLDPRRPVRTPVDGRVAALRALGRCAGAPAEETLRGWLRISDAAPETLEAAAYGLGEASAVRGSISGETASALLDAVDRTPAIDAAFFAFGRTDAAPGDGPARLLGLARAALARAGSFRTFTVKALGRAGPDAVPDLARVLGSPTFTAAERAEAARGLGRLHGAGQASLSNALAGLLPGASDVLGGDAFGILRSALEAIAADPLPEAVPALRAFANLAVPADAALPLRRRASQLRCLAAVRLARGAWDSDVLRGCDVGDGQAGDRARLTSLDRGELTRARRAAWLELTRSSHPAISEAAIEAIGKHPELGDAGLAALASALGSSTPGLVGTASDVVQAHPDRMFVLAASERRAALDPRSPPPTSSPAHELDPGVGRSLRAALAHPWGEDAVETRVSLLDAAFAVGLDEARGYATTACHDANATLRARAAKALVGAGDKAAACPPPDPLPPDAPELDQPLAHATRVAFETDAGPLGLTFDPALAPVAATRLVALARSGFFTGVVVHRVVPAFVAQLGDPGGDGYGGAGRLLRCETSPVTFAPLDIGVALAGRDTGSSQFFVTLARQPHLDGQYAWLGRADGDWAAVAEGDVVQSVRVEP